MSDENDKQQPSESPTSSGVDKGDGTKPTKMEHVVFDSRNRHTDLDSQLAILRRQPSNKPVIKKDED